MDGPIRGPFAPPHPHGRALQERLAATPSSPPPDQAAIARAHRMLYDQVPSFECEPGCTQCCGAVPMSGWEWGRLADQRIAEPGCSSCPYAEAGRCAIHAERPLVCRLFGAVDDPRLRCPKGCGPSRKLPAAYAEGLMRAYQQLLVDVAR